jgi:hypothetical protein
MSEDTRCCGTGTCIINDEGFCWCGQRWDGEKMCFPERTEDQAPAPVPPSAASEAVRSAD